MNGIKLILVDPQMPLCVAFEEQFKDLPNVEIINGYFEQLTDFDCIVSASNSFGLMDGGIDLAIVNFFGKELRQHVQETILKNYQGEQPVGTSTIIETDHPRHPFVAYTPTMRVPMKIAHTDNVYLAMWAILLAVSRHNTHNQTSPIRQIACPGLGTAAGQVPFREAARQMALAYKNFIHPPQKLNWLIAYQRQDQVRYGGDLGFHYISSPSPETE